MKPFAEAPATMRPSGIREIMALVAQMPDAIHLEVGEPNFQTPEHVKKAAYEATMEGFTKYTPSNGLLSLREALVEKMRRVNKVETTVDNIVVTVGGVGAIASTLMALLEPGEEVLIPDPGWPNYEMMILCSRGVPVRYRLAAGDCFQPNPAEIEKLVTSKTKAILVNSPANPTGAVLPAETLREMVAIAKRHGVYLISDEVYEQLIFDGEHVSVRTFDQESAISCHSFSKTYAMTGWRVGYVVAPVELARLVTKIQEPYVSCTAAVSQKAAEAALKGPQDCVEEMRQAYKRRRDLAVEMLQETGMFICKPSGAFYIMADISRAGMESYDFAKTLLREEKVAVAPGATFGEAAAQTVRVSLANSEDQLAEGLRRLGAFVERRSRGR